MYLDCILQKLNLHLRLADERFAGSRYFTLAYPTVREEQTFPTIIKGNEAEQYIGIDDAFPLTIYHRLLSKPYQQNGDYPNTYVANCQLMMVVHAKGVSMDTEQLESLLLSRFPNSLNQSELTGLEGIHGCKFVHQGSDFQPIELFNKEYKNVEYRLSAEHSYFAMRYSAQISFDKSCLNICDIAPVPSDLCGFIELATALEIKNCMNDTQVDDMQELICEVVTDCSDCDPATVKNSDNSFSQTVVCGGTLVLPDETLKVYIDGNLNQSTTKPALKTVNINISL